MKSDISNNEENSNCFIILEAFCQNPKNLLLIINVEEKQKVVKTTLYLEISETLRIKVLYFFAKYSARRFAFFLLYNLMA